MLVLIFYNHLGVDFTLAEQLRASYDETANVAAATIEITGAIHYVSRRVIKAHARNVSSERKISRLDEGEMLFCDLVI